ncbi:TonB-dependent receptor [Parvularcula sp. ZS-1/3]|uniref:TonB-dependent receptor n=1 Tax=Parvularcula mediterranea TaxID=2732508 RepID=A0A7Y3RLJ1_9PROT|nr:TonB-dependent receptor [Parvularcula mediterranea]NNU16225.1 TonB-dependent receptor [Parvularcula mediterranea]
MKTIQRSLMLSAAVCAVASGNAFAQDNDEDRGDEIIVTGVARPTTQLESTASVTSLSPEQLDRSAPRSTAEAFRVLPGIQVEPSSGDANTNLKVRGMPISAGGSRYVSFQEDGFPTLLVGDIAFGTADSFLRFDRTVGSVQAIRGGSASTAAPNAPGGIINLISKTGEDQGGSVAVTTGLNYNSVRGDFEYGMPLNETWSAHIGGFVRTGEGVREAAAGTEEGGQIKATLAGDFDRGSMKVHFKHLDDKVPTYLPIPARYNGSGFEEVGVDFGDGTIFFDPTDYVNRVDGVEATDGDGFEARMTSIAFVGEYELTDHLTANFRHRTAKVEGNFASPFPAGSFDDPQAGPSTNVVYFNTQIRDFDNSFTEASLTKDLDFMQVTAGVNFDSQDINTNWNFNQYNIRLDGDRTFFDQGDSVGGALFGNPAFGNCCTRSYDFEVDLVSPFIALTGEFENLSWDLSYRDNQYDVSGSFAEAAIQAPQDINGDGTIGANEQAVNNFGAPRLANYEVDFDAWSAGVNYQFTPDIAVFANIAEGGSLSSPDRVTGNIAANGTIQNDSAYSLVEQWEMGFKYSTRDLSFFVTYFNADTTEAREFEVTTQQFRENAYEASGFEVEGHYKHPTGFGLRATATLQDAEIVETGSGANVGNKPRRQADYVFNVSPYFEAERWTVGANVFGTDEVFIQDNNDLSFDAYNIVSVYGRFDITENISVSADVNNLFDEEGFTEGEEGSAVAGDFVRIRPINGRNASLTLSYRF